MKMVGVKIVMRFAKEIPYEITTVTQMNLTL